MNDFLTIVTEKAPGAISYIESLTQARSYGRARGGDRPPQSCSRPPPQEKFRECSL